ncbi:hypothetical protein NUSPORA_01225 [Nucleospora cyclopteri]
MNILKSFYLSMYGNVFILMSNSKKPRLDYKINSRTNNSPVKKSSLSSSNPSLAQKNSMLNVEALNFKLQKLFVEQNKKINKNS